MTGTARPGENPGSSTPSCAWDFALWPGRRGPPLTPCNTIKLTIDKCKIAASQGRQSEFHIRYGEGIDDVRSVIDIATAHGIVKKSGSWYSWERANGDSIRVQGKDTLRKAIEESDGAWPELHKKTLNMMLSGSQDDVSAMPVEDDFSDIEAILTGGGGLEDD